MKAGAIGGIVAGVVIVGGVFFGVNCTTKVPTGNVAVQYDVNGGVKDEVLTQGWHWTSPWIKTTLYNIGLKQSYLTADEDGDSSGDDSIECSSKEGKALTCDLTFTYQYNAENVVKVFNNFSGQSGTEIKNSFIKPNITSWVKEVVAQYKVADLIGSSRAEVNQALSKYINEKFDPYGISVTNVSLSNISVDSDTKKAIDDKIKAQQAAETQAIENQTAIDKAEADKTVAETNANADAEVKKIQADADAYATQKDAEAEAEANEKIAASLTPDLLKAKYYETWNGQMPSTYIGDSDAVTEIMEVGSEE